MSELKTCPFCGRSERDPQRQVYDYVPGPPRWCGYCPCGATGPTAENGDDAIALWNHRPEEDRLRSALKAAERERDEAKRERDASYEAHAATIKTLDAERAYREQERAQRDSARLEAGRLAQDLDEVTGKLALAEVEAGRLRVALEWVPAAKRLPTERGAYLCTFKNGGFDVLYRTMLTTGAGYWSHGRDGSSAEYWNSVVTHWRKVTVPEALEPKEVAGG